MLVELIIGSIVPSYLDQNEVDSALTISAQISYFDSVNQAKRSHILLTCRFLAKLEINSGIYRKCKIMENIKFQLVPEIIFEI